MWSGSAVYRRFDAVRSGTIPPTPADPGQVIYKVDDISFLMRAPATTPK